MWRTGVLTRFCWDGRGLPFSIELEIPPNSTGARSNSPGSWRSPGPEIPPKPPNLRHFRGFVIFGPTGSQKYEKGVGIVRKMIYLGRHKI